MKSLAEIRQAIDQLTPRERAELRDWLDAQDIEESPEFLAAVDEGIRSAENEPKNSLEDVIKRLEEIELTAQAEADLVESDRDLFFFFNYLQRLSTWEIPTTLKGIELLSPVTLRTSLEGRSTRSVGRKSVGLKRSVRVQVREVTDTELVLRDGRRMRRNGARIDQGVQFADLSFLTN